MKIYPAAFIALGSNLGNSRQIFEQVLERIEKFSTRPLIKSSFWQTTPVDCPPGSPPFLNAVIGMEPLPNETPETLLQKLQALEREFGRQSKKILNEARPLDLDVISFGSEVRDSPTLVLPHPRARERRFVLEPLAEIAPGLIFPGETKSVAEFLVKLPLDPSMRRITG